MPRFYAFCFPLLLIGSLAACTAVDALQVGILILSLPDFTSTGQVRLKGYSLGPVSSTDFPELLENSVPASEGDVLLAGHASWSGLSEVIQPGYRAHQTVAAMTDTKFLFLWWNKEEESYEILMRLLYDDIEWISTADPESGKAIKLCHEIENLSVGDETIAVDELTQLSFMSSNYSRDSEKTKAAFKLLNDRVAPIDDLDPASRPCEPAYEPDFEQQGFGEDDLQNLG